jgi:hypothetical protein
MHPLHFIPKKQYFSVSGSHFCYSLSEPPDLSVSVRLEGLGKLKKITSSGLEPATFWFAA